MEFCFRNRERRMMVMVLVFNIEFLIRNEIDVLRYWISVYFLVGVEKCIGTIFGCLLVFFFARFFMSFAGQSVDVDVGKIIGWKNVITLNRNNTFLEDFQHFFFTKIVYLGRKSEHFRGIIKMCSAISSLTPGYISNYFL